MASHTLHFLFDGYRHAGHGGSGTQNEIQTEKVRLETAGKLREELFHELTE